MCVCVCGLWVLIRNEPKTNRGPNKTDEGTNNIDLGELQISYLFCSLPVLRIAKLQSHPVSRLSVTAIRHQSAAMRSRFLSSLHFHKRTNRGSNKTTEGAKKIVLGKLQISYLYCPLQVLRIAQS